MSNKHPTIEMINTGHCAGVQGIVSAENAKPQIMSTAQVHQFLQELPRAAGQGLHDKLEAVLRAQHPGSFSEALGELEVYLAALGDTNVVRLDQEKALKDYVLQGWKAWRSGFEAVPYPHGCPYCGTPAPDGEDLVLDEWGHFHCSEEECHARLTLDEGGRVIGHINKAQQSTAETERGSQE